MEPHSLTGPGALRRDRLPVPWLRPTVRATRWWPLVAAAGVAAIAVAVAARASQPPPELLASLLLAGLAAGLALGLDDPAHDLLAALPSGTAARLLHRLVLLTAATVGATCALAGLATWTAPTAWPPGPATLRFTAPALHALVASAVATHAVVLRRRPDLAATVGASVPVGWVVLAATSSGSGPLTSAGRLWLDHAGTVTLAALAVGSLALVGPTRPARLVACRVRHRSDRTRSAAS